MANPANQPISGKSAKMALFNPSMKFEIFGGQMTSFEAMKVALFKFIQNISGSVQLRPSAYLSDKLDYLKNPLMDFKNSFWLGYL